MNGNLAVVDVGCWMFVCSQKINEEGKGRHTPRTIGGDSKGKPNRLAHSGQGVELGCSVGGPEQWRERLSHKFVQVIEK